MKRYLLLIVLLSSTLRNCYSQVTYSKEVQEQIAQVEKGLAGRIKLNGKTHNLLERMAELKVKGLSIAVVNNFRVVWAKGYGWADEKEKRPVTTETLFEPGSISKSLNAVGLLKLVQDKKLDLHTDINTYLKSWKFPYDSIAKGKKITLAHLLSHSAGLTVHGFPGYNRKEKRPTVIEILNGTKPSNTPAVRSMFEPGLKFKYSGGGSTISQLILTDVSGEDYEKFMYREVLKPMGMEHSFYNQPPESEKLKWLATGYRSDGSEVEYKFHVYPEQAAAGLWMTPTDLCNYIIETQLAYLGRSSKVLNAEMTKQRLTPYLDESAALGVFIEKRGNSSYFQHGAGNEGFRGQYYGDLKNGNGVAVFVNSDNGSILFEVINSVAEVYGWKDFYTPIIKNEIVIPDDIVRKYLGIYLFEDKFALIVKKEDGYYYLTDGVYAKMHFTSETEFFNVEFLADKTFSFDSEGKVTGFKREVNGKNYPAAVKIYDADTLHGIPGMVGNLGWYLLENKQFDEAINFINRAIQLSSDDLNAVGNLGHCYLFKGEHEKAIQLYREFLEEADAKDPQRKNMIAQDFVFFKQNGFDTKVMDKAFLDLHLEIPEAYKTR